MHNLILGQQVRDVLLYLKFYEIITPDPAVLFFQHPERGLVKLRKYEQGLDKVQVEAICELIKLPFNEFNELYQKARKHGLR